MSKKHTPESVGKIAAERNHILVNMDGYKNAKSLVTFRCGTCNTQWSASLTSYL
jgi:hypothetical protein